jgi:hypothetical protein
LKKPKTPNAKANASKFLWIISPKGWHYCRKICEPRSGKPRRGEIMSSLRAFCLDNPAVTITMPPFGLVIDLDALALP